MKNIYSKGFTWIPAIIIVAIVGAFSGGIVFYQKQQSQQVEVEELKQEITDFRQETDVSKPSPTSQPSSTLTHTPKPAVKAATITVPTSKTPVSAQAPTEPNIPLIVEQEFVSVFGRKPSGEESAFWKERMRKNSYSRETVRLAMQREKEKTDNKKEEEAIAAEEALKLALEECINQAKAKRDNFLTVGEAAIDEAINNAYRRDISLLIGFVSGGPGGTSSIGTTASAIRARYSTRKQEQMNDFRYEADSNYDSDYRKCHSN